MNYHQMVITKEDHNDVIIDAYEDTRDYLNASLSVIPIVSKGKIPAVKWTEYQSERCTEGDLQDWFYSQDYNVGIVTGKLSDVVVLDIDSDDAYDLAETKGLPDTPTVKTGRGFHLYFKYREGVRNFQKRKDLPGIDLRGEGGYVVAPPSIHSSGAHYKWVNGKSLEDLEFADLPDWVLAKAPEEKPSLKLLSGGVADGERNGSLTRLLGSWVKTMSLDEVVEKALAWNESCNPPDDEKQVLNTVKSIWDTEHSEIPVGDRDFGEPVLFDVELPTISADYAPSCLCEFARAVSKSIQVPEGMTVMLGLAALSTALQKKITVSVEQGNDYKEHANIWAVIVADPSERKSPVLKAMMAPVVEWEQDKCEELQDDMFQNRMQRDVIDESIKQLKKEAAKEKDNTERQELLDEINVLRGDMPDEVKAPMLWTGNVTTERLEQLLVDNDEKMAVVTDEGGIFEVMGGLYNNGKANMDIYMQGYSGNPVRSDRASRSAHLKNPLLTFGIAIQPKVLQDLSRGGKKAFRGTGLLARFLYYQCESQRGQRFFGKQVQMDNDVKDRYHTRIKELLDIDVEHDEFGNPEPTKLYLDDEARDLWINFYDEVESNLAPGGEFEQFADWAGKLPGNTLRIAGLYHVLEHGIEGIAISKETMQKVISLMQVLIPHAKSALSAASNSSVEVDAKAVYEWIVRNGQPEFNKRDCHRGNQSKFSEVEELMPALNELIARNIIRAKGKLKASGRPSAAYEVNPVLISD